MQNTIENIQLSVTFHTYVNKVATMAQKNGVRMPLFCLNLLLLFCFLDAVLVLCDSARACVFCFPSFVFVTVAVYAFVRVCMYAGVRERERERECTYVPQCI